MSAGGTVGVVVALTAEARTLGVLDARGGALTPLAERALLCLSGVGPERARRAAEALLAAGADALVSWGVAGGLDPRLEPGALIVPERVLDQDREPLLTDPAWGAALRAATGSAHADAALLVSVSRVLATAADKAAAFACTGAAAVDMESGAVGRVARSAGLPFVVLRAVSDPAAWSLPRAALGAVDEYGRPRPGALALGLLREPTALARLLRLRRSFATALARLRAVAQRAGPSLARPRASAPLEA